MAKAFVSGDEKGSVFINCPGCKGMHSLATKAPNECGAQWTWNGSVESPTFSPSLNASWYFHRHGVRQDFRCHSFIREGKIEFLQDCTHELKGQTVDLLEWNEE